MSRRGVDHLIVVNDVRIAHAAEPVDDPDSPAFENSVANPVRGGIEILVLPDTDHLSPTAAPPNHVTEQRLDEAGHPDPLPHRSRSTGQRPPTYRACGGIRAPKLEPTRGWCRLASKMASAGWGRARGQPSQSRLLNSKPVGDGWESYPPGVAH
jgi:hypothetical protein